MVFGDIPIHIAFETPVIFDKYIEEKMKKRDANKNVVRIFDQIKR